MKNLLLITCLFFSFFFFLQLKYRLFKKLNRTFKLLQYVFFFQMYDSSLCSYKNKLKKLRNLSLFFRHFTSSVVPCVLCLLDLTFLFSLIIRSSPTYKVDTPCKNLCITCKYINLQRQIQYTKLCTVQYCKKLYTMLEMSWVTDVIFLTKSYIFITVKKNLMSLNKHLLY